LDFSPRRTSEPLARLGNLQVGAYTDTNACVCPVQHSADSTTNPLATTAENGCATPTDIKAKLGTHGMFGTRLFVNCRDLDTVLA
jgi:hypothetical protein